jgi:NAD(P)-dependent dehydrogenase (short-subunit alcohol dehydrogenase family)
MRLVAVDKRPLQGRGYVITGGSGHLGSAMVGALLADGALVVAVARGEDGLGRLADRFSGHGARLVTLSVDVRRSESADRAIAAVDDRGHRFSGWVNNANTASGGGLLFSLDRTELDAAMCSLSDLMLTTQTVAAAMIDRGEPGSIVNIASMYGVVAPDPRTYDQHPAFHNPPAYGAVKAGMLQFTRYAATHLAEYGIRVNAVSPGPFPKPLVQQQGRFIEHLEARVPLGRIGQPREIAGAVRYLLGDESSYVTGTNIVVDGGWTAW